MAFPFAATIAAQAGPQTAFLRSGADICVYGGAAGGGKTAGLILEPLRHGPPNRVEVAQLWTGHSYGDDIAVGGEVRADT